MSSVTISDTTTSGSSSNFLGAAPDIDERTLENSVRVVPDTDAGIAICDSIVWSAQKLIFNAARITSKCNGERPWPKAALRSKGKNYKRNCSTRFLQQQCAKVAPRFYQPLMAASTLTAARLPSDWPDGPIKTDKYRRRLTETIRSWPKWDYFLQGVANEITKYGLGYASWFDEYEWRPHLLRMDKGFVPQGTELMDEDLEFFVVKWFYHPSQLLELLKSNVGAKREEWKKAACVEAINHANPPPLGPTFDKWRDYENLVRQSVWSVAYWKSMRLIDTYHLFAKESSGEVSHYVYWRDGTSNGAKDGSDSRLLYESKDEYDSINDVVVPIPFGYGDGSIQGSWGVGQLLYDMANQVEIARNEAMDAQSNQGKLKLQVAEGRNVNDVKLTINDDLMTVEGAQFASPGAATPANPAGFKALDDEFTMWALQIVGNYVPPIPLQPSDTKATAINAAQQAENEVQNNNLQNFLKHIAYVIAGMGRRLAKRGSPDEAAKAFRKGLLEEDQLTEEEIKLLTDQPTIQTIAEFTPQLAAARAQWAASRQANPNSAGLYDPRKLEEIQSQAIIGGKAVLDYCIVPEQDGSTDAAAARQQTIENVVLDSGQNVQVLAGDKHATHYAVLQPHVQAAMQNPNPDLPALHAAAQHLGAHYAAGVSTKTFPDDQINPQKSFLAELGKSIQQHAARAMATQQTKMAMSQMGPAPATQQAQPQQSALLTGAAQ